MTGAEQAVVNVLADGTVKPIEVIARAVGRHIGAVKATLNALERAGVVRRPLVSDGYRLSNEERTRRNEQATQRLLDANIQLKANPEGLERIQLETDEEAKRLQRERAEKRRDDLPDPPGAPPKVPRDGLPDPSEPWTIVMDEEEAPSPAPAAGTSSLGLRTEFQPKCRHCTDWSRLLPDTQNDPEGGWCNRHSDYRAHFESHDCHSDRSTEPTDAELDAIEAEEADEEADADFDPAAPCSGCEHLTDYDGRSDCDAPGPCPRDPASVPPPAEVDEPAQYDVEAAEDGEFPSAVGLVPAEPENSAPREPASPGEHVWGVDRGPTSQTFVTTLVSDPQLREKAQRVCAIEREILQARERLTDLERDMAKAVAEMRGLL